MFRMFTVTSVLFCPGGPFGNAQDKALAKWGGKAALVCARLRHKRAPVGQHKSPSAATHKIITMAKPNGTG